MPEMVFMKAFFFVLFGHHSHMMCCIIFAIIIAFQVFFDPLPIVTITLLQLISTLIKRVKRVAKISHWVNIISCLVPVRTSCGCLLQRPLG